MSRHDLVWRRYLWRLRREVELGTLILRALLRRDRKLHRIADGAVERLNRVWGGRVNTLYNSFDERKSTNWGLKSMDFFWNDGGRSASGFVGFAGDCVTRSIAIATGRAYRELYRELGAAAQQSPRNGLPIRIAEEFLKAQGWESHSGNSCPFDSYFIPKGRVILYLAKESLRHQHLTTVIDEVIYDTWNPEEEEEYVILRYWTPPADFVCLSDPKSLAGTKSAHDLTQAEFEKIMNRLRALDRTATNHASTEGEKHNALRMMQSLMLRHNLSRSDIVDEANVDSVLLTRRACALNGAKACTWEKMLAKYVTEQILPTTQWYLASQNRRSFFWFYGPKFDVENVITLFRELLMTIATSAHLKFGGHVRGSGASYAEGYVVGLPRQVAVSPSSVEQSSESGLIQVRTLALHSAANDWLEMECNIRLQRTSRVSRSDVDPSALLRGKSDGAKHEIHVPNAPPRIGHQ